MNLKNLIRNIILCVAIAYIFYDCAATSNCYTARTLERKQVAFSPGLDYIALIHEDEIRLSKEPPFLPALGIHYGLTNRIELGLRGFFPYTLEAIARCQITPHSFRYFDLSANLHYGTYKIKYLPYLKSGFTIGRKFWLLEPFAGYYWYDPYKWDFTKTRVINLGLGFDWKGATVIPEINWQYKHPDINNGIGFIGIGIRAPIEKKKIK